VRTENGRAYGDVIEGVDFPYLAQVTRLNAVTLAALASAPAPPSGVKIEGAVSADTKVSWAPVPGRDGLSRLVAGHDRAAWTHARAVGAETSTVLRMW
jgi:hypothetical protein